MSELYSKGLVWLRRDLRLDDHKALSEACHRSLTVAVVFVFDSKILNKLKSKKDRRVSFIFDSLIELDQILRKQGSQLIVKFGDPIEELPRLMDALGAQALFFNEDYEVYAKKRDESVRRKLHQRGIKVFSFKDQVIFSGDEVIKTDGQPYQVFTPYKKAWLNQLKPVDYKNHSGPFRFINKNILSNISEKLDMNLLGFEPVEPFYEFQKPGHLAAQSLLNQFSAGLKNYQKNRDYPALEQGTSGLSVHLRFGTISIRECLRLCQNTPSKGAETWLSELIWREFYQMILDQCPRIETESFKIQYKNIKWENNKSQFKAWCEGLTGFPIVDAGMRQLNQTGWMHNRVRMIVASFLVKDLLIDWRWGESYFAEKLLDFDLSSNNGSWQWIASVGCDAQPYFRVFNPSLQSKRFDEEAKYIKHWVPELKSFKPIELHRPKEASLHLQAKYPKPIINHAVQKKRIIEKFYKPRPNTRPLV